MLRFPIVSGLCKPLLSPRAHMALNKIFVAATSQHVGKTTSTLGLLSCLRSEGLNTGYCKPVGQQFIDVNNTRVDKDALLFSSSSEFDLVPELHSPVILGPGATTAYLDQPTSFHYGNKILKASKILQAQYDVVVYEGTGHPGVGSVVGLSNAKVADMLSAGLIMVVEAGIGNTIDLLELNLSMFEQREIPILGVIINKAIPAKINKVEHYVGNVLKDRGINLLGVLPYDRELGLPVMHSIVKAINGKVELNEDRLDNRVMDIIAGSLIDLREMQEFSNHLLVVSVNRLDEALKKLEGVFRLVDQEEYPLSGIIITGDAEISKEHRETFLQHRVPVVRAAMDTYEVVIKISRMEVKINTRTPWKVKKAIELFNQHIDLRPVLDSIDN